MRNSACDTKCQWIIRHKEHRSNLKCGIFVQGVVYSVRETVETTKVELKIGIWVKKFILVCGDAYMRIKGTMARECLGSQCSL